jgi:uncharacterized pyridoxamine 5'-phosphate oxidase family protein
MDVSRKINSFVSETDGIFIWQNVKALYSIIKKKHDINLICYHEKTFLPFDSGGLLTG